MSRSLETGDWLAAERVIARAEGVSHPEEVNLIDHLQDAFLGVADVIRQAGGTVTVIAEFDRSFSNTWGILLISAPGSAPFAVTISGERVALSADQSLRAGGAMDPSGVRFWLAFSNALGKALSPTTGSAH
ncbi:MAG: hypothetical protein WA733_09065 [Methylocystis sp.]